MISTSHPGHWSTHDWTIHPDYRLRYTHGFSDCDSLVTAPIVARELIDAVIVDSEVEQSEIRITETT